MPEAQPQPVLVIISDLIFRSKIDEAARRAGVPLRIAKSPEQLERHLGNATPAVVLMDLEMEGADTPAMLLRLRTHPEAAKVPVIGFAGHTNVEVIHAARADGVQVMARSAFVAQLPAMMDRIAAHARGSSAPE
ncbi:MAG TPA: response regulator [Gemmatimonadaceae bacterium]|nr:response regulator [Gemmatimonadaceae bacterium]